MPKLNKLDNQGQVLLIVVVALAVLLGVGLSISSGTLSSITRTSRTDSLQKVTAAAEGGLESYLLKSDTVLSGLVSNTPAVLSYSTSNTKSTITVGKVTSSDGIIIDSLDPSEVATFYFAENPSSIAKNNRTSCISISMDTPTPDFMLNVIVRNPNATIPFKSVNLTVPATGLPAAYNPADSNNFIMEKYLYSSGGFSKVSPTTCGSDGKSYLFTDAALLRLHPINKSITNLKISLVSSQDPNLANVTQGYKITSVGQFTSAGDATTRTIEAVKYLDSPSNIFDYAAFIDY